MVSPRLVVSLYGFSALTLCAAFEMRIAPPDRFVRPLERAEARGELAPGIPRLDADDPMANAAILQAEIDAVSCSLPPRRFTVLLDGQRRHVRAPSRVVCALALLKRVSAAQAGGLGEIAAFLLATPRPGETVELGRVIVPPFSFTHDTVHFIAADLGALRPGEKLVGTWHTHPADDRAEGTPSRTDLAFMRYGYIDFHGQLGSVWQPLGGLEWLFDVIDPRDGSWNVYSHDRSRLDDLRAVCDHDAQCPLDDLRTVGSDLYMRADVAIDAYADAGAIQ